MSYRPHMLPKVRSEDLMQAIGGKENGQQVWPIMPCTMRIAGLIHLRCAEGATVVGSHTGPLGKGMSTKVSDATAIAGCMTCHGLYERTVTGWKRLYHEPELRALMFERLLIGTHETQAMLFERGIITIKGATLI